MDMENRSLNNLATAYDGFPRDTLGTTVSMATDGVDEGLDY